MNEYLLAVIIVSELIALYLLLRLWKSNEHVLLKFMGSLMLLLPCIGPLFFVFVFGMPDPQSVENQNRGPRGDYTHSWISMRNIWKQIYRENDSKKEKNT